ncbi:NlpC/P60 family protein [Sphingomonas sp. Leaf23]|uniref:NlpC/P60 family protein n=1 Tax=Sphingomonas sp. Leaf23 TaxID=1735689 RepID=UPI0022859E7D|nr:TIGR02594 family protein [Sphingomonas sp. Leaf23]
MRFGEIDRGARGQQVQMLQHLLNTTARPRPPLELDGVFGQSTERAVRSYQQSRGLEVDGVVGAKTWSSLGVNGSALPRTPSAARSTGGTPTRAVTAPSIRNLPIGDAPLGRGMGGTAVATRPAPARPAPAARPAPHRSAQLEPPGSTIGAPWMRVALAEKGVAEVAGRTHNPRIVEYHATTTLAAKTDEVAWCASFVNWCLEQAGIRGIRSARAADWGKFGVALSEPRYGCIVHIYRTPRGVDGSTGSSSGNHVAFFVGQTATHIQLLGGNQGNQVKVSGYPLKQYTVKAMRWPEGR